MNSVVCRICGNHISPRARACPHCGFVVGSGSVPGRREKYRTVNLKADLPTVDECCRKLRLELHQARADGLKAVKFIHGYGSSGVGGKLRHAVRESLDGLSRQGQLGLVVYGEDLREQKSTLIKRLPLLKQDLDLKHMNKGVTLVILK